jgi:serine/threonine-protein kinase HipA
MATDRQAVVWTRLGGQPRRMGRLYVTDRECRFTYDGDFIDTGLPGLGIVYAPEFFGKTTIVRQRSELFDLLPPLQSLIPPRNVENFQRNLALKSLAAKDVTGLVGFDTDWEILKIAGHGGIGHLDLFENDDRAQQWYAEPPPVELHEITDELGFSLKEFMAWYEDDLEVFIQTIGPTPTVGGAIPKLLMSIPSSGWDGRIGLPTRQKSFGVTDVVLKFEQTTRYPGIIELEALAMDMHRAAGFEVPRCWPCFFKDMPALAVERFDRDADNMPIFTETLYSIIASGAPVEGNYGYRYDLIAKAIDTSAVTIATDARAAKHHLFRRFLMATLTGNGDLHLENMSIMQINGLRRFTPVYDPAPMRAYAQHDLLSVMPFGDYAEIPYGASEPVKFAVALARFAKTCGLTRTQAQDTVNELLAVTESFEPRVAALATLPEENKARLISRVRDVREKLS